MVPYRLAAHEFTGSGFRVHKLIQGLVPTHWNAAAGSTDDEGV